MGIQGLTPLIKASTCTLANDLSKRTVHIDLFGTFFSLLNTKCYTTFSESIKKLVRQEEDTSPILTTLSRKRGRTEEPSTLTKRKKTLPQHSLHPSHPPCRTVSCDIDAKLQEAGDGDQTITFDFYLAGECEISDQKAEADEAVSITLFIISTSNTIQAVHMQAKHIQAVQSSNRIHHVHFLDGTMTTWLTKYTRS